MTPNHLKAARAMLGWGQDDLAKASALSISTIRIAEQEGKLTPESRDAIVLAFHAAGLVITDARGEIGIRMKKPRPGDGSD